MRQVVWLLLLFAVAVLAASTLGANDGLVSIYWSPWRIDLSFNVFVILLLAVGAIAHVVTGAVASLIDLPQRARQWRLQQREQAAQKSLREAFSLLFAGRYGRAHKAAQQALDIQAQTPGLRIEPDFAVLAHLVAAGSLHRLQDQARRDEQLARAQALIADMPSGTTVGEGARMLAAEWAVDDRDADRALDQLALLPAGVARRTHALRLKLQATRLARQPLEALKTARLLAKHQGFTPIAARGLLRSLAAEAIEDCHDLHQLQRLWQQLDAADRADASVAARAAARAGRLGSNADAREWLRPFWDRLGELDRDDREAVALALFDAAPGIEHEWLPRLEAALEAHGHDSAVVAAVGMAFADRQLWGKARKLLEQSAAAGTLPLRARRRAWRALAQMAREAGDDARAQDCERAAAALE